MHGGCLGACVGHGARAFSIVSFCSMTTSRTPQKLLDTLFLKANNPLYVDIDVNGEWLEAAVANDAELCEGLVEQRNENTVELIVDSPTDIAMDCPDSDNIVEPYEVRPIVTDVVDVASSADIDMECNNPLLLAMYKLETIYSKPEWFHYSQCAS